MKKSVIAALFAVAAVAGMTSCSGDKQCNKDCADKACAVRDDLTYTGVLPAADCAGIRYTIKLDYDDNKAKGDYDLVETYLEADSVAGSSKRVDVSFKSEGDFTVVNKDGKKFLKLVKDAKDSNPQAVDALNLEVTSDSTLVVLNDVLESREPSELNYTLTLVK